MQIAAEKDLKKLAREQVGRAQAVMNLPSALRPQDYFTNTGLKAAHSLSRQGAYFSSVHLPLSSIINQPVSESAVGFCIDYLIGVRDSDGDQLCLIPKEIENLAKDEKLVFLEELIVLYDQIEQDEKFPLFERAFGVKPMESFLDAYPFSVDELMELLEKGSGDSEEERADFFEKLNGIQEDYLALPFKDGRKIDFPKKDYFKLLYLKNPCYALFLGMLALPDSHCFGPALHHEADDVAPLVNKMGLDLPKLAGRRPKAL
ncbi:hypothetical protein HY501_02690 [Candidatus Woesearchaeota archaeon]|nr:hypothetical protein [Candidatus Woesearchaeota archaeon]